MQESSWREHYVSALLRQVGSVALPIDRQFANVALAQILSLETGIEDD